MYPCDIRYGVTPDYVVKVSDMILNLKNDFLVAFRLIFIYFLCYGV